MAKEKQKVRQHYNGSFQAGCFDVIQPWLHGMMFIEKSICNSDSFMVEWMKRYFLYLNETGMWYNVTGKLSSANAFKIEKEKE